MKGGLKSSLSCSDPDPKPGGQASGSVSLILWQVVQSKCPQQAGLVDACPSPFPSGFSSQSCWRSRRQKIFICPTFSPLLLREDEKEGSDGAVVQPLRLGLTSPDSRSSADAPIRPLGASFHPPVFPLTPLLLPSVPDLSQTSLSSPCLHLRPQ